ncbi:MAG TPA: S-layer homology domain-containing protein, partial [Acidimicrobiia bacterium]|nr:S-layer homology domain-containing protein [Acidimicrobiia bacterium]
MWSKSILTVLVVVGSLALPAGFIAEAPAQALVLQPGGTFQDDDGSIHEGNIEAIHAAGITNGCSATRFCPDAPVTREQMAAFIDRAIDLPPTSTDAFGDDDGSPFEDSIDRLAQAGITRGCTETQYCPAANVTRGEMASFLVRSFGLEPSQTDHFVDDAGSSFEPDINSLASAGITLGCGSGRYCPHGAVTRAEMASFLARALGLSPIVPPPSAFAGSTIHVEIQHPSASDANTGTAESPLRTIQQAVERASALRRSGQAVRILIGPGVYREHVNVGHSTSDAPQLLIEAKSPGTVRVTGTDVWTGWQSAASGVYAREWPFDWSPAGGVSEIVGRREMAFHDGVRLQQVLSFSALVPGSFFVDQPAGRIYVAVSGGAPASIEVSVRPQVLKVDGAKNVTIRGVEFSGAASAFGGSAVQITNVGRVQFVDNLVRDNSWVGVSLTTSSDVTVDSSRINHNGGGGMNVFKVPGVQLLSTETSGNNWRGVRGDYIGLTIAGVKVVGSHDFTVDGHTAVGNHTRGLWFDYDVPGLVVRNSRLCGNLSDGLFIEASQGPSTVSNTVLCDNGRYGLLIANGRSVTLTSSTMCGNGSSGLRLETDGSTGRTIQTAAGSIHLLGAEHLTLTGNLFGRSPRL